MSSQLSEYNTKMDEKKAEKTQECEMLTGLHYLVCYDDELPKLNSIDEKQLQEMKKTFCGNVVSDMKNVKDPDCLLYFCGDVKKHAEELKSHRAENTMVVAEYSSNFEAKLDKYTLITSWNIPRNLYNVGVFFPSFFDAPDYFERVSRDHKFQTLTESTKMSNAFRTGLYLTSVVQEKDGSDKFNLLRCSSNFAGPTENFSKTDHAIITPVNIVSKIFFGKSADFNHVLAQIYENKKETTGKKREKKAGIKAHSDKTKDMPRNGLIAFGTFYHEKKLDLQNPNVFTKLRFRLKSEVKDEKYEKKFDVILYPNSLFIISLKTNRLYTHEIVGNVSARMGYVMRCSNTEAVFRDGRTYYTNTDGKCVPLEAATDENVKQLKDMYYKENMTIDIVEYGDVNFSMNSGDYTRPKS